MKSIYLLILVVLSFSVSAFAQEPGAGIFDKISSILTSGLGASTTIAIVLEVVLRIFKTPKPLSLLYAVSFIVHKIAEISTKMADLLDKVVPQRIK